jgi:hypothetical protein
MITNWGAIEKNPIKLAVAVLEQLLFFKGNKNYFAF